VVPEHLVQPVYPYFLVTYSIKRFCLKELNDVNRDQLDFKP
jgi:hypothetical protein